MGTRDKNIPLLCRGHSRPVRQVVHSNVLEDGAFLIISACLDGKPILREGITGDWIGTFLGHNGAVFSAVLNADATLATTASSDFNAKVWSAVGGQELLSFSHSHVVKSSAFLDCDRKLVTGGIEKKIRIFDLEAYDADPVFLQGQAKDTINCVLAHPSSPHTIITADDKFVRTWDVRTGAEVQQKEFGGTVSGLAHTCKDTLLSLCFDHTVQFLDPTTTEVVKSFKTPELASSASLHPDKGRFVAGGRNFYVYVYDYETGAQLEEHKGHHGPVHSVSYAPDGETYASGSEDGTVRIWQNEVKEYGLWKMQDALTRSDGLGLSDSDGLRDSDRLRDSGGRGRGSARGRGGSKVVRRERRGRGGKTRGGGAAGAGGDRGDGAAESAGADGGSAAEGAAPGGGAEGGAVKEASASDASKAVSNKAAGGGGGAE